MNSVFIPLEVMLENVSNKTEKLFVLAGDYILIRIIILFPRKRVRVLFATVL